MKVDGNCHCGNISFEAKIDPEQVTVCHCTDCQTLSGSAYRVVALIPDNDFTLLNGEVKSYVKIAESGNERLQTFCPNCGTPIYSTSPGDGPKLLGLRVGSLRQRDQLKPVKQIWCRSAQNWVQNLDNLQVVEMQEF